MDRSSREAEVEYNTIILILEEHGIYKICVQ